MIEKKFLTNLIKVVCFGNGIISLKSIKNPKNLEVLKCFCNNLTSLDGTENFIHLKLCDTSENYVVLYKLTSLKSIENLPNLEALNQGSK